MSEAQLFATMTFAEIYERVLVQPLFRPFAEALVARLSARSGDSVLDVACGTGIVARIARERLGRDARIAGVDAAPPMLAVARVADPTIDWRQGSADGLPVAEGERFSCLTCHQGLQFFPDKAAAVREMRRALEPNGRAAIGVWRSLADLPVMRSLNAVAERHLGPIVDSRHSFGNTDVLAALLADAGFKDVHVDSVSHAVELADGALFARLNAMALIGMTDKGKSLLEPERAELAGKITTESKEIVARHTRDGAFVLPLISNTAVARA